MQGTVVSWELHRGYYGFIRTKDRDKHIFFHGTAFLLPHGEVVSVGDIVEFDLAPNWRHPDRPDLAVNVKVVKRAEGSAEQAERAPQRYLREDMTAEAGAGRRWRRYAAAEALFRAR